MPIGVNLPLQKIYPPDLSPKLAKAYPGETVPSPPPSAFLAPTSFGTSFSLTSSGDLASKCTGQSKGRTLVGTRLSSWHPQNMGDTMLSTSRTHQCRPEDLFVGSYGTRVQRPSDHNTSPTLRHVGAHRGTKQGGYIRGPKI